MGPVWKHGDERRANWGFAIPTQNGRDQELTYPSSIANAAETNASKGIERESLLSFALQANWIVLKLSGLALGKL